MAPEDKARMIRSLAEFGDLSGVVLNRRTGLLIGGHQRADVLAGAQVHVADLDAPEPDGTVGRGYLIHGGRRYSLRVVDWTPEKAHAALLAANRYGRVGEDDAALLKDLLQELDTGAADMDLTGYTREAIESLMLQEHQDDTYTNKIVAPVYEPKGDNPPIETLIDRTKTDGLQAEIDAAQLPADVTRFLKDAAERHTVFHFGRIAEWYCHATPQVQDLMEKSGMVIIDFNKAIEYGFVHLTERLGALADLEESDGDA
jgi:hypothetical protein